MKLAIVGWRHMKDSVLLAKEVGKYENVTEIVSGGASGADSLAENYAELFGIDFHCYPPRHEDQGKGFAYAAKARNQRIVDRCDEVLAFVHPSSKGTWDTINKAKKARKPVRIVELTNETHHLQPQDNPRV